MSIQNYNTNTANGGATDPNNNGTASTNWLSVNSRTILPIPINNSDYTTRLMNKFMKIVKDVMATNNGNYFEFHFAKVGKPEMPNIYYDAIAIGINDLRHSGKVVYQTLILEATNDPVAVFKPQFQQNQFYGMPVTDITIRRFGTEGFDQDLKDKIEKIFKSTKDGLSKTFIPTNTITVPRSFDIGADDKDSEAVSYLLSIVCAALARESEVANCIPDVSLAPPAKSGQNAQNSNLSVRVQTLYQPWLQVKDSCKNEIRSDIVLKVDIGSGGQPKHTINNQEAQNTFSKVSAYTDLLYAKPPVPDFNAPAKFLIPNIVITNVEVVNDKPSIGKLLLSIIQIMGLVSNNNYFKTFRGGQNPASRIDLLSLGCLDYESNAYTQSPTGFGNRLENINNDDDLLRVCNTYLFPKVFVSIDLIAGSPNTAVFNHIGTAATGNDASRQLILNAADTLTCGYFSKEFGASEPIFTPHVGHINYGTYVDNNGEKRDIRFLANYLAVANWCQANNAPDLLRDFNNGRTGNVTREVALKRQDEIVERMANGAENVSFTHHCERYTFSASFIEKLNIAFQKCANEKGIKLFNSTPEFFQNGIRHSNYNWLNAGGVAYNGVFGNTYGGMTPGFMPGYGGYGRFM